MIKVLITTELVSSAFLLCALLRIGLQKDKDTISRLFMWFSSLLFVFTLIDAFSYIMEAQGAGNGVLFLVNVLSYLGADMVFIVYAYYVWAVVNSFAETSKLPSHIVAALCSIDMIFTIVSAAIGKLFYIDNGVFVHGEWNDLVGISECIGIAFLLVYLFAKKKSIGLNTFFLMFIYVLAPIVAIVVQMCIPEAGFVYASMEWASVVIYVFLQTGRFEKEQIEKETIRDMMYTDPLTDVKNRLAFNDVVDRLPDEEKIELVFCDINGLKHTNDTFGHIAGDNLIISFVEFLKKHFDENYIFRLSGDEFLVFFYGDHSLPKEKLESFRKAVRENSWIASVGYGKGTNRNINSVIRDAEKAMYGEKTEYYTVTSRDRRRR